jgi:hypothetical protein
VGVLAFYKHGHRPVGVGGNRGGKSTGRSWVTMEPERGAASDGPEGTPYTVGRS